MTDEAFACVEDIRERKRTARGIHNKRTHNGKGGRVKTPSDYLTKKERLEMSGECVSYKLNEPMTFEQLKTCPKDIQKEYLDLIIKRYHPERQAVMDMLGITSYRMDAISGEFGIKWPKGAKVATRNDAFNAWRHGVPLAVEEKAPVEIPKEEPVKDVLEEHLKELKEKLDKQNENPYGPDPVGEPGPLPRLLGRCIPESGRIVMSGTPAEIAETIAAFLGSAEIRCTVEWEVL